MSLNLHIIQMIINHSIIYTLMCICTLAIDYRHVRRTGKKNPRSCPPPTPPPLPNPVLKWNNYAFNLKSCSSKLSVFLWGLRNSSVSSLKALIKYILPKWHKWITRNDWNGIWKYFRLIIWIIILSNYIWLLYFCFIFFLPLFVSYSLLPLKQNI